MEWIIKRKKKRGGSPCRKSIHLEVAMSTRALHTRRESRTLRWWRGRGRRYQSPVKWGAIVVFWSCIQLTFEPWPAHSQPLPFCVPPSGLRGQHVYEWSTSYNLMMWMIKRKKRAVSPHQKFVSLEVAMPVSVADERSDQICIAQKYVLFQVLWII